MQALPLARVAGCLAGLLAAACVPGGDGQVSCSKADRTGSYVLRYTELSGDCGPIADEIGRFENGVVDEDDAVADCEYDAPLWSDEDCVATTRSTCTRSDGVVIWEAELEQTTDDGSALSGIGTLRFEDPDGNLTCSGRYRVAATRQDD